MSREIWALYAFFVICAGRRRKGIYHPLFVAGGRRVVAGGECAVAGLGGTVCDAITIFDVASSKVQSKVRYED